MHSEDADLKHAFVVAESIVAPMTALARASAGTCSGVHQCEH
jgi:hypothetical protein